MRYSQSGLHLTEAFEDCKLRAYQDVKGVWTIGYGHTEGVSPGMTCSPMQAEVWLRQDVATAVAAVNRLVKGPLTQNEFDALVDFTFNAGAGSLAHSTLLQLINAGDDAHAAAEFEKWDKSGGKVVAGLLRRRVSERELFSK